MNQPPRGHIECPAKGCRDGLFRVDLADGPNEASQHGWLQCRACNGLGYIWDPTIARPVGMIEFQGGPLAVLDDGSLASPKGPGLPGTPAHRETEDG